MFGLAEQIKNVIAQMDPANLPPVVDYKPASTDIVLPTDLALLVIDVQRQFCDPKGLRGNEETREVSQRIQSLVPEFRKAGIPTYVVYFSSQKKEPKDVDFYEFQPEEGDTLIAKSADSAFRGSDIKDILQKDKRKTLLTCGFNLNACVYSTVMDAIKNGFDVCLLRDLTGNDNNNDGYDAERYVGEMKQRGMAVSDSHAELQKLAANGVNSSKFASPVTNAYKA